MKRADVAARVRRLDRLACGLAKETMLVRESYSVLLYAEQKAYLAAVQDIRAGLETARVTLARALRRTGV